MRLPVAFEASRSVTLEGNLCNVAHYILLHAEQ